MFFLGFLAIISGFLRWIAGAYIILLNVTDAIAHGVNFGQAFWIAVAVLVITFKFTFEFEEAGRKFKLTV